MNYFLLSSVHEYLLNNLSDEKIIEIKRVYKNAHNNSLRACFYVDGQPRSLSVAEIDFFNDKGDDCYIYDIPLKEFFDDYYSKRRMSIHFLYAVRDKKFAARVLLSNHYLRSLNLQQQTNAKYVQCLCVPQFQPKSEDYIRLNRLFHSFAWKTPIEQQMLLSCNIGNTVYDDFRKILDHTKLIDTNANIFKAELLSYVDQLNVQGVLALAGKLHLLNRYADIQKLQTMILLGFYLWLCVDFFFGDEVYPIIDRFANNQKIIFPHGILHITNKADVHSTLHIVFTSEVQKMNKAICDLTMLKFKD